MKYSFEHGERSRRGKKKAAVVNKKTLRRLVGFVLVLVTLLAAFQTGVLAATGDTSASTVEVAAQSEGDASGAQDVQQGEVQQDEILDTSSVAQEYTVTLFVGDDQYLEPIAVQDGKIAQPDALAADKVPEGMAFKGWYTQKEDGEKFDAGRAITEDLKLYAQFEQVQDQEDEAAAMADPEGQLFVTLYVGGAAYGDRIPVFDGKINMPDAPDSSVWPQGASAFLGWFTDPELETAFDTEDVITEHINLYAKFEQQAVFVYFLDADNAVVKTLSAAPGDTVEEPNADDFIIAPDSRQFMYWADSETGDRFDFTAPLTKDVTLIPVFSSSWYAYFYSEGTQIEPVLVKDGEAVAKPETNPTREGYTFQHWSTVISGPEYDFTTPVTDTLRLHAVWKASEVSYSIIYWTEKPNISGTPSWPQDYVSYATGSGKTLAGTEITDITQTEAVGNMPGVQFFEYGKTIPTTIQGNGLSVVNVCYDRIVYTMQFILYSPYDSGANYGVGDSLTWEWLSASPQGWSGTKTFDNPDNKTVVYEFDAKYEQDISSLWPSFNVNTKLTNYKDGGVMEMQPTSWMSYTVRVGGAGVGDSMVTKRLTLSPDLIPNEAYKPGQRSALWYIQYDSTPMTVHVNYWFEALDGQEGESAVEEAKAYNGGLNSGIYGRKYVRDESLSQTLKLRKDDTLTAKDINGMIRGGYTDAVAQPDGSVRYDFYYNRSSLTLKYNSQGGSAISSVNNVKHGQDIKRYLPADPQKDGYTFAGWYYDSNYKNPVDWENDTVSTYIYGNNATVSRISEMTLFAKWESSANTVSFYDRQGSIAGGSPLDTQGVATGNYVNLSTPVTMTVDGMQYSLTANTSVPGYGEFIGWYWLQGTERMPFSADMPINKSYDLFALWKVGNFTITYDQGEAATGMVPVASGEYALGTQYKVAGNTGALSVDGKTFIGWKSSVDGKVYYAGTVMEVQGNTILTAQFAEKNSSYLMTYKPGYTGSSQQNVTSYVKKGTSTQLPNENTFTRPGFVFAGWESSQGGLYEAGTAYTPSGDETMTAKWTELFTVSFQAAGGGSLTGRASYANILEGTTWQAAGIVVPTPVAQDGYYFAGWDKEIPGQDSKVTANATYTAKFEQKTTVTITALSAGKPYDGQPLTANGVTEQSLAALKSGDTVEVSMKPDSTQTNAGSHANEIAQASIYRVINGVKTDVTKEYNVNAMPGMLTVDKMKVKVTPNNTGKTYGDPDQQSLTATTGATINGDTLHYTVTRETGEDVKDGGYQITITPGDNANYEIVPGAGVFTITKRDVKITADNKGKMFGTVEDPALTAVYTDPGTGTVPVYSLSRVAGETVGTYPITVTANPADNPNYNISTEPGTFRISPLTTQVAIIPQGNTKIYGDDEPELTAIVTGVPEGSPMPNYRLVRVPGGTVGTYKISVELLDGNENYGNIDASATADFTITKKQASIEIAHAMREYGDQTEEVFHATVSGTINGDVLSYTLQREKADVKDVGRYMISAVLDETSAVNRNYNIEVTKNDFKIDPRPVTLTADDQSITYGDSDPSYTAKVTSGTLVGTDKLLYTFEREQGTDAGGYEIRVLAGSNPNYTVTPAPGTLTIGKKIITVTPKDTQTVYGDDFDLKRDVRIDADGLLAGDALNYDVVRTDPDNRNVGEYELTVNDGGNKNYIIETGKGKLEITQRPLTITPDNNTKAYGDPDPVPLTTVQMDNIVNGDKIDYTLSRVAGEMANIPYTISVNVNKAAYPNYSITLGTGKFTVTPLSTEITISPNNTSIFYGGDEPELDAKVTGIPEGETLNYTVKREAGTDAGTYRITVELGDNPNYDVSRISTTEGSFVIKPRPVTVKADDKTMEYGSTAIPELSATALANDQDANSMGLVGNDKLICDLDREAGKNAGSYTIHISARENKNYAITTKEGNFEITRKPITVAAGTYTKTYGDADPEFKATVSELVQGDVLTCLLQREPGQDAGKDYAIHPTVKADEVSKNYSITPADGKLTIDKKQITVTPNTAGKVYGDADPDSYGVNAPDLVTGDTLDYSVERVPGNDAGSYDLTLVPGENPNYDIVPGTGGTLVISPRPVTLSADNNGKIYGTDDPELTATVTNGTVIAGDTLNYTVARKAGDDADTYPIHVTAKAEENKNYTITVADGTFTISQKTIEAIIIPDNTGKVYGNADPELSAKVISPGGEAVDYTLSRTAGENAGGYEINVTLGDNNPNYNVQAIQLAKGTFTISPRPATVAAIDTAKAQGTQDPVLTANVTGLVGTDALNFSLARDAGEEPGTYAINVTLGDNPNYAVAATPGVLTITAGGTTGGGTTDTPEDGNTTPPADPGNAGDGTTATTPAAQTENANDPGVQDNTQTTTITENDTPLSDGGNASSPTVNIGDNKVPLMSNGTTPSWALLNLILAFLTGIIMFILLFTYFFSKDKEKEDDDEQKATRLQRTEDESSDRRIKRRGLVRILSIVVTLAAVLVFIFTEDITLPMVITDQWTWVMAAISVAQVVLAVFARKGHKENDGEDKEEPNPQMQNI